MFKAKINVVAAVVLMVIAGAAKAELMVEITQNPDPAPGLESFTVTAVGVGEVLLTIGNVEIVGDVHQVWPVNGNQTATPEDLNDGTWKSEWDKFDTHFLIPDTDILTMLATLMETNDNSDPANLNLEGPFGPNTNPMVGLGMLAMDMSNNQDQGIALDTHAQQERVDILQVVTLADADVFINVELRGTQTLSGADISRPLNDVPEPGTFAAVLLVGGVFASQRRRFAA